LQKTAGSRATLLAPLVNKLVGLNLPASFQCSGATHTRKQVEVVGVYEMGFARVPLIVVLHIALVELAGGFHT
jgi:hypothetical protein